MGQSGAIEMLTKTNSDQSLLSDVVWYWEKIVTELTSF